MSLNTFISKATAKETLSFNDSIAMIHKFYIYTPTNFSNGLGENCLQNSAGTNEGSCKIFAFAKLHQLDKSQTLNLFGDFYHQDTLNNPNGNEHQNIRNFMQYGWEGVKFSEPDVLRLK